MEPGNEATHTHSLSHTHTHTHTHLYSEVDGPGASGRHHRPKQTLVHSGSESVPPPQHLLIVLQCIMHHAEDLEDVGERGHDRDGGREELD